jgi:hypothetical protein
VNLRIAGILQYDVGQRRPEHDWLENCVNVEDHTQVRALVPSTSRLKIQ